jgi:hypothetical protein
MGSGQVATRDAFFTLRVFTEVQVFFKDFPLE